MRYEFDLCSPVLALGGEGKSSSEGIDPGLYSVLSLFEVFLFLVFSDGAQRRQFSGSVSTVLWCVDGLFSCVAALAGCVSWKDTTLMYHYSSLCSVSRSISPLLPSSPSWHEKVKNLLCCLCRWVRTVALTGRSRPVSEIMCFTWVPILDVGVLKCMLNSRLPKAILMVHNIFLQQMWAWSVLCYLQEQYTQMYWSPREVGGKAPHWCSKWLCVLATS